MWDNDFASSLKAAFCIGDFFSSGLELSTFDFKEESSGRYGSSANSAGSSPCSYYG